MSKEYFGKNYTTIKDAARTQVFLEPGLWDASVKVCVDTFVSPERVEEGSHIFVGRLKQGARPLFTIVTSDLGEGVTAIIGHKGKPNLLGAFYGFDTESTRYLIPLSDAPMTGQMDIFITIEGGSFGAGKRIRTQIYNTLH